MKFSRQTVTEGSIPVVGREVYHIQEKKGCCVYGWSKQTGKKHVGNLR